MNMVPHIVSLIIFLPLAGAIGLFFLRKAPAATIKVTALVVSIITFLLTVVLLINFDSSSAKLQFVERAQWIPSLHIQYAVGIDGISILLLVLTGFLTPIAILGTWNSIKDKIAGYAATLLILETGILGVFAATDLILFYVFWEGMLVPMYFLIGIWGGSDRIYAALKFFLYTMAGSVLMLVAIIWLGIAGGPLVNHQNFSSDLFSLYAVGPTLPLTVQSILFFAFALSFAIKVPLFPFHTWLPDAHVQAPTAGSVILAGVLLKMGTYGLLRFCIPLFPQAAIRFAPLFGTLAVIGIIYGALLSIVQTDVKKLVAYSSVSHLGFVVLGLFAMTEAGIQGSLIQMINHGLSTGGLFLMVGLIYDRRHTREISEFGGLARILPVYATLSLIIVLSSAGLPGLNGFIGEFMIMLGSFSSPALGSWIFTAVAGIGVILSAVYLLWMYQRVFFGPVTNPANQTLKDLSVRESLVLGALIVVIVWIGIYPSPFLTKSGASVRALVEYLDAARNGIVGGFANLP